MVLDGKIDAAVQSNQFNQLLTQKTTAIFVGLNDAGALPTLAHDANDNGVLFQAAWNSPAWYTPWHSDVDGDKYNTFLMPDEYVVGRQGRRRAGQARSGRRARSSGSAATTRPSTAARCSAGSRSTTP